MSNINNSSDIQNLLSSVDHFLNSNNDIDNQQSSLINSAINVNKNQEALIQNLLTNIK